MDHSWQVTTLHPISLSLVKGTFTELDGEEYDHADPTDRIELLVERIMSQYNAHRADETEPFERSRVVAGRQIWHPGANHGYRGIGYSQVVHRRRSAMDAFFEEQGGTVHRQVETHSWVVFFANPVGAMGDARIFGVTTGSSWRVLTPFRDFYFACTVGGWLLDSDVTEHCQRPLLGDVISRDRRIERGRRLGPIMTSLALTVRLTGPLRDGVGFPDDLEKWSRTELTLLKGGLRLNARLSPGELCHLANFYDGCFQTYMAQPVGERPLGVTEQFDAVQPIIGVDKVPLNRALIAELFNLMAGGSPFSTSLRFSPPHRLNDYCQATKCKIFRGGDLLCEWPYHATTSEIIAMIAGDETFSMLLEANNRDGFASELRTCMFEVFSPQGESSHKLLSCFEGEIIAGEAEPTHCFHLDGKWYTVNIDWVAQTHASFQECLSECLVREGQPGHLPLPWPEPLRGLASGQRDEIEGRYNAGYIGREGFFCGDKVLLLRDIELFDILDDREEGIVRLHQVKAGLAGDVRAAMWQILIAARRLQSYMLGDGDSLVADFAAAIPTAQTGDYHGRLPNLAERLQNHFEERGGVAWLSRLLKGTAHKNIIFVLSVALPGGRQQLEEELGLAKRLRPADLEAICEASPIPVESAVLLDLLKQHRFLDAYGRVTAELLRVTFDSGRLAEQRFARNFAVPGWGAEAKKHLRLGLREMVGSSFKSIIPRAALIHLEAKLARLGFGFEITQIVNETHQPLPTTFIPRVLHLDPIERHSRLVPGSRFAIDGLTYRVQPTTDDGASCLHAALGQMTTRGWRWQRPVGGRSASMEFRIQVESELRGTSTFLDSTLEYLAYGWLSDVRCTSQAEALKRIASQDPVLPELIKTYTRGRRRLERKYGDATTEREAHLINYIAKLGPSSRSLVPMMSALGGAQIDRDWARAKLAAYTASSVSLIRDYNLHEPEFLAALRTHQRASVSADRDLLAALELIETIDTKRQALLDDLMRDGRLGQCYVQALTHHDYPVGWLELELASKLYMRSIRVLRPSGLEGAEILDAFGQEGAEVVVLTLPSTGRFYACTLEGAAPPPRQRLRRR